MVQLRERSRLKQLQDGLKEYNEARQLQRDLAFLWLIASLRLSFMTQTTFVQKGVKVRLELACQIHAKTEMSHCQ